jgi:peptidyl-dipeptidase A
MKKIRLLLAALGTSALLVSCGSESTKEAGGATPFQEEAQHFLDAYTAEYVKYYAASSEAQWQSQTLIKAGDSTAATAAKAADEAMAAFTGSAANIDSARKFLAKKGDLTDLQKRQFDVILYAAANNPQTIAPLVKERIAAETDQTQRLYGYQFVLRGKKVSPNELDDQLRTETSPARRLEVWEASKAIGGTLQSGLLRLRNLRNQTVNALGYPNYFAYQVSDYGLDTKEMMALMQGLLRDLWPLYRELHTWMRYEAAKRYGVAEVPAMLPAHWLPNRWGQDWSSFVKVEGMNLDSVLKTKSAEWIVKNGEGLYTSIGFPNLPPTFWEKSSLYPYPADSALKKNTHASAWHMDLNKDVRSLMSVEPNSEWWETANHELGHIYYYMSYSNPEVPPLLRQGANRAYHEAVGTMMGLAAMQKPYLVGRGLIPASVQTDSIQSLLKEALNSVVFIFFSAGTMSHFEKEMYADSLSPEEWNNRWWALSQQYQGIVPPNVRDAHSCDAATKTHINDDPAQYYDYALSYALLYQLHNHIARNILKQDPRATNYWGHKEVGDFIRNILKYGASKDWRQVLKESTGDDLNAKAMLDYFSPLTAWLQAQNKGRTYTLTASL